jgi:hypothetical protein
MPTIEDRISDELRKVAPRPDGDGLYEHLETRMRRKRLGRRLGSAALGVVVVAGTLAGYVALDRAFNGADPRPATPTVSPPAPSETPQPTSTPEVGRDLGLGFRVCDVRGKQNIDFFGDGSDATVWTAIRVRDGSCPIDDPTRSTLNAYLVAVDFDDDGRADAWTRLAGHCTGCAPFAATDFDADGRNELVVLLQHGTTPQYGVYKVGTLISERGPTIERILVRPGNEEAGFPDGRPIVFWAGGDEGFSASVDCEGYPNNPVLILSWSNQPVDAPGPRDVFITALQLVRGTFEVTDSQHISQPVDEPPLFDGRGSACGVDFDPWQ